MKTSFTFCLFPQTWPLVGTRATLLLLPVMLDWVQNRCYSDSRLPLQVQSGIKRQDRTGRHANFIRNLIRRLKTLWMLIAKIVPYTTNNTKLMGNFFFSAFMVWFQILKQQKFNKEKTFIKISFFPPPTRSAVCRFTTETDQSQRVTTS